IGKKISLAMAKMLALVIVSALPANLAIISIQGDVCDIMTKSSPLIMATQAMNSEKSKANLELNNYLKEDDPEKLGDIKKRYIKLIGDHDLCEQKMYDAIDNLPYYNKTVMMTWLKSTQAVMSQHGKISEQVFETHHELLSICHKRMAIMDDHEKFALKLLKLLAELQNKYTGIDEISRPLMQLNMIHANLVLTSEGYITDAKMRTPENRLKFRKEFAMHGGEFFAELRTLKQAPLNQNDMQVLEIIFQTHNDFVNSAVGQKQLFDLYEMELALLKNRKKFIADVNELHTVDLEMAKKLLELASINLTNNSSIAYSKAGNISKALLAFCVLALIISVWVTMNLSKRIARPVLALAEAAGKIAAGDFNQKINVCNGDEISDLCRSFNKMSKNLRSEVSVRKKAERHREQLLEILEEKNRELQNVVYVASHDLRSPLVTINGFSEELGALCGEIENILESEDIDEGVKNKIIPLIKEGIPEDLRFINAGAEKMQMLVGGLLQISRAGTAEVEMTSLDMNEMLKNICHAMQYELSSKNISIDLKDLPPCFGDAVMINQVFSNLLDNAVKYRKNNGEDKIVVSGWIESGNSIYCVEDNGIGISENCQSKIFEVFHRLDPQGPVSGEGLGLTIISRILDRHQGRIWVESEPGIGSKFFVSIPSGA
ncbi:MAG: HAMP domain-containing histidine kinase, partial [Phycisphaerae bacterium]|nr:HAMP domain-containing histidine kinase [Phycisphaerae bacterium]